MYKYDHLIKKIKEIDPSFPIKQKLKKVLNFKENKKQPLSYKAKLDKAV